MKKTIIVIGLVAVMICGVAYVYAQNPTFCQGHPKGYGSVPPLTPEQETKFQELRRKSIEENAKLTGEMMTKRLELQSLWSDPKADPKAILDKEKEMTALQNQMRDKVVQMKLEARKFLTPEQIANWKPGRGMGRGRMMADCGRMMIDRGHKMGSGRGVGHHGQGKCQ